MKSTLTLLFLILCLSGWAQKKAQDGMSSNLIPTIYLNPHIYPELGNEKTDTISLAWDRYEIVSKKIDTVRIWIKLALFDGEDVLNERWYHGYEVKRKHKYVINMCDNCDFHFDYQVDYYLMPDRKTRVSSPILQTL